MSAFEKVKGSREFYSEAADTLERAELVLSKLPPYPFYGERVANLVADIHEALLRLQELRMVFEEGVQRMNPAAGEKGEGA